VNSTTQTTKRIIKKYVFFLVLPLFIGCGSMEKATYFYGTQEATFRSSESDNMENILQPNDLLSISISSVNQEATEIFNASNQVATGASMASGVLSQASGYLVDKEGFIRFPILGELLAAGRTKQELRDEITNELTNRKLLLDPVVDIRFLNFRVSVLGEVKRPNVFTVPSEKISILEALSLAGDITIDGDKEQVALIREEDGNKVFHRINLTTSEVFSSDYFYLQSNDILYIAPRPSKVAESSVAKPWIPVILSAISLSIITILNFR